MAKKRKQKREPKSRSRKRRQRRAGPPRDGIKRTGDEAFLLLQYYWDPFVLLHDDYERAGHRRDEPHPIRERFWRLVPPRICDSYEARPLLQSYLQLVEREMAETIAKNSLGYWLHLYRRIWPGPIGRDTKPQTIGLTRAFLEAAIQKYARIEPCERVGFSHQVPIQEVLGGLLQAPRSAPLRDVISSMAPQLVLTKFTSVELAEFYDLEKLAYEGWRTAATLRIVAKGAPVIVRDDPASFYDDRSPELAHLVDSFDERQRELHVSSTGTVFEDHRDARRRGHVFLPAYNLGQMTSDEFPESFWQLMKVDFASPVRFNFIWWPFNLRGLRSAHEPLGSAFRELHGVSLDAVLVVIAALCARVLGLWCSVEKAILPYWQRGYEGLRLRTETRRDIHEGLPAGLEMLGLDSGVISEDELDAAIEFWELTEEKQGSIDLPYSGPHSIFLPFGQDRWYVDYAWILRRLYDLFVGVSVDDQNFKGIALEEAVRRGASALPVKGCKAEDGSVKQVDAAFMVGDHLVIVECKAVGWSIAYDRGDPNAIAYRLDNVVERGLREADAKARWLSQRPKGRNYDVTGVRAILPVAVSPFVEFIPSAASRYWVSESTPRVLTPHELSDLLERPGVVKHAWNRVQIKGNTDVVKAT